MRYILVLLCLWCPFLAVAGGNIEVEEYPEPEAVIAPGPFQEADTRFISAFCRGGFDGMAESVLKCYGEKDKNTRAVDTCLAGDVFMLLLIDNNLAIRGRTTDQEDLISRGVDARLANTLMSPGYAYFRKTESGEVGGADDGLHLLYYIFEGINLYSVLPGEDGSLSPEAILQHCSRYAEHPATDQQ